MGAVAVSHQLSYKCDALQQGLMLHIRQPRSQEQHTGKQKTYWIQDCIKTCAYFLVQSIPGWTPGIEPAFLKTGFFTVNVPYDSDQIQRHFRLVCCLSWPLVFCKDLSQDLHYSFLVWRHPQNLFIHYQSHSQYDTDATLPIALPCMTPTTHYHSLSQYDPNCTLPIHLLV